MALNIKFIFKQGIKKFHEKFVLAPADKAGNSAIVVCQLQYINTIKSELSIAKTYELILQIIQLPKIIPMTFFTKFGVRITENQEKLLTFNWLPKLHERLSKLCFIANSCSFKTTSLSKVLTYCLIAIKNHWIKYFETIYERDDINLFSFYKNSTEFFDKLKANDFQASLHDLRPLIDSEINHKIRLIKFPFTDKGNDFIDLPSILG